MSISEWLAGERNYLVGVKLYEQYGGNSFLKKLFANETVHTKIRLLQELTTLKNSESYSHPEQGKVKVHDDYNELPAFVQSILLNARQIYREVAAKHSALSKLVDMALERWNPETDFDLINNFLLANGSEKLAMEIILGEDECTPLFEQVDYYRKHKALPASIVKIDNDLSSIDISELYLNRNNLRSKISKHKNNEKRASDVFSWRADLTRIQKQIDELI